MIAKARMKTILKNLVTIVTTAHQKKYNAQTKKWEKP